jgi:aspartyl-tRNA(Asn)/glutamyl-tRNA(Gln) amidotransferase subunit C
MQMITKEEVKNIVKLSNLNPDAKQIETYAKEMSSILEFFEVLKEIDTSQVEPMVTTTELEDVTFMDKIKPCPESQELIKRAPKNNGDYLQTKGIL